ADALDLDVTLPEGELVAKILAQYGLTPCTSASSGEAVTHLLFWRLLPFLFLLYVVAYLDRINVGFAALQMKSQLNFSDAMYGAGAGIFFLGYFLFQVPSNMAMQRFGARRWIAVLMILWGGISASMMFVSSAKSFYTMRFLLGAAEAGFFPGVIYYLRNWFPAAVRARALALFIMAGPISGVIGGPISGALLGLHRRGGLAGRKRRAGSPRAIWRGWSPRCAATKLLRRRSGPRPPASCPCFGPCFWMRVCGAFPSSTSAPWPAPIASSFGCPRRSEPFPGLALS